MIRFDQRVAIVTGAGNGLGREYALYLAARGARVLVNNRRRAADPQNDASALLTVRDIVDAGGTALANFEDVADPLSGERMVGQAIAAWGRVDILVNNAGVEQHQAFHKMSIDAFRRVFDVNFHGTLHVTHAAYGRMRRAGYGRILTSTSSAGLHGLHGLSAYSASKAALIGFTRAIAAEGAAHNVLTNAIAPYAATRMTAAYSTADMQRSMPPSLVAPLAAYLVSDQTRLNGQVLIAGKGGFRRAAVIEGAGVAYRDASRITPEQIESDLGGILDMTAGREYSDALAAFEEFYRATPGVTG